RPKELVEALLLIHLKEALTDRFDEAVRARVVLRRLVVRVLAKHEVAIEELLPLLHLAFEDAAKIGLIADDRRREHENQVGLLHLAARRYEEEAEDGYVAEERNLRLG